MTIAAGILCDDGIVLCADSEVSLSTFKLTALKAFIGGPRDAPLRAAVVGAGNSDMIELAKQKIASKLMTATTINEAWGGIADAMTDVYSSYMYPDPESHKRDFDL